MDRPQQAPRIVPRLAAIAAGAVVLAGVAAGALGAAWERRYDGRVLPGVTVGGAQVGGMAPAPAAARIEELARPELNRPVTVHAGREQWTFPARALGRRARVADAVDAAMAVGRTGNIAERVAEVLRLWRSGIEVPLAYDVDVAQTRRAVTDLSRQVSAEPRDAAFTVVDGRLVTTDAERDGLRVNVEGSVARAVAALAQPDTPVELVAERAPAALTSEIVARIAEPVASFTTSYPYSRDRVHNIHLAAAAFRGVVLSPGAVLSYNGTVGPRVASRGYRKAPVLVNNELVPGDGGGVCQVSSTLFNAGLLADLRIEARVNHSRPVPYLAPGRDATVAYGIIDLRMRNTTGHTMIAWSTVTSRSVTITFYGLPQPGRRIEVVVTDHKVLPAPNKTVVKHDRELPAGTIKEERARTGLRARTYRVIRQDGVEVRRDFVASNYYQPTPHTVRIGTGAPAPAKRAATTRSGP
jgi:vancomycin resistance protein YoaR